MTILDVKLGWSRSNGEVTLSADGKNASAKFSDGWNVTHTYDTTELEILQATGLPTFSSYKLGTFIPCTGISIEQRGLLMTLVRIDYERSIVRNDPTFDWAQNPLNAPPIIRWDDETTTEPIDQDADGAPLVTVNKEPINGITIELPDPVLIVILNFETWNPHIIHQYRMSVNSDTFASFPAGTGRLVSAAAELIIDPTYGGYWRVTARVRFRYPYNTTAQKSWYARVRHEGFLVKTGADIAHALDDDNNKVVTPVLLKSDGTRETVAASAHWLEFKRYFPLPYANLGLL
jgi:hypothetical protein